MNTLHIIICQCLKYSLQLYFQLAGVQTTSKDSPVVVWTSVRVVVMSQNLRQRREEPSCAERREKLPVTRPRVERCARLGDRNRLTKHSDGGHMLVCFYISVRASTAFGNYGTISPSCEYRKYTVVE